MYFNDGWKFLYGECENGDYRGCDDSAFRDVTLPHDWSVEHDFDINESSGTGYLPGGIGWYRKHFDMENLPSDSRVFITFNGVYNNSRVWCNSNYLGKRPYGYSSFVYEITDFLKEKNNVIAVKVTRPETADSRWFTGTGIYRDVTLDITGRYSLSALGSVFVKSVLKGRKALVEIDYNIDGGEAEILFEIADLQGEKLAEIKANGENGSCTAELDNPRLWSDESPYLYTLKATVFDGEKISDTKEIKFGIRSLEFDCNNGLFVNGKETKLRGVCVHHDSGALGAAFYKPVWKRRLEYLKKAGCNAIRTSHNPPDPLLLDLCDEMGFYVMDEAFDEWEGFKNKWWQGHNVYPPKHFGYADDFHAWHEKDLSDMIKRDRNHPSIIMWSIGNEVDYPNDPYGYFAFGEVTGNNDANKPKEERIYSEDKPDAKRLTTVAKELVKIVKKHDLTRPVTAALSFPEMCEFIGITDVLDIAGYNYRENFYDEHRQKHPERFIYGSENGHNPDQWKAVKDRKDNCGQFLWTGIDYLGEAGGWPWRASGAGIMDLAGYPKNYRYALRKTYWSEEPTLEIYTSPAQHVYLKSWNGDEGDEKDVTVVTNLQSPIITINGGEKLVPEMSEEGVYRLQVKYSEGEIKVTAADKSGKEYTDSIITNGEAVSLDTKAFDSVDTERNIRLVQIETLLKDADDNVIEDNDRQVDFEVIGGELLGIENGDIKDLTSYCSASRNTLAGKLIAYIRATPDAKIEVKITSGKLSKALTF